jgi:hypothetical protein
MPSPSSGQSDWGIGSGHGCRTGSIRGGRVLSGPTRSRVKKVKRRSLVLEEALNRVNVEEGQIKRK